MWNAGPHGFSHHCRSVKKSCLLSPVGRGGFRPKSMAFCRASKYKSGFPSRLAFSVRCELGIDSRLRSGSFSLSHCNRGRRCLRLCRLANHPTAITRNNPTAAANGQPLPNHRKKLATAPPAMNASTLSVRDQTAFNLVIQVHAVANQSGWRIVNPPLAKSPRGHTMGTD